MLQSMGWQRVGQAGTIELTDVVCIRVADSFCGTVETNITLKQLCSNTD